jgi:hypothetical protein
MAQNNDTTVSKQWMSRPDDQRFLSLEDLANHVKNRANHSQTKIISNQALKAYGTDEGEILLNTEIGPKFFTNWSFGQTAALAGAPAAYLRRLTSPLAAACLNEGFSKVGRDESMVLANGNDTVRALTSPTYGRIWDYEVVEAVQRVTEGGNWAVPSSTYSQNNPKRATTLYGSDRDVFVFMVDEKNPIEVDGDNLFRGFYAWNSEVGSAVFGLATFLYRTVCDNRIIWGVSHKSELRIRHTSGAPERFLQEGQKTLLEYSNESAAPIIDQIRRAKNIKIGNDEAEVMEFLKKRGMQIATAKSAIEAAKAEEGEFNTPWSIAQGITAHARSISHTDVRVQMEREAGRLLQATTA